MADQSLEIQSKYAFFHANSKTLTSSNQYISQTKYSSGHVINLQGVLSNEIEYCSTSAEADSFAANNPDILVKYDQYPLTELVNTNSQTWYIDDGGSWAKPFITHYLVPHPVTNDYSAGFYPFLYQEDGSIIPPTMGSWWIDPFQGIVKFDTGYTPADMGWGNPKLSVFVYIGDTLQDTLASITPIGYKYTSPSPSSVHSINHNLDTFDLITTVMVEHPVGSNIWYHDLVKTIYSNSNTCEVQLTEECNIKMNLSVVL